MDLILKLKGVKQEWHDNYKSKAKSKKMINNMEDEIKAMKEKEKFCMSFVDGVSDVTPES